MERQECDLCTLKIKNSRKLDIEYEGRKIHMELCEFCYNKIIKSIIMELCEFCYNKIPECIIKTAYDLMGGSIGC